MRWAPYKGWEPDAPRPVEKSGFIEIDGWVYTQIGGMIFPTNKRVKEFNEQVQKESETA